MKIKISILIVLIFGALNCSGSKKDSKEIIRIKGSDTMLLLTNLLAAEYMSNSAVSIYVEGGGTATGIKALGDGEIDICTASRTLKGEEVKILAENYRSVGMSTIIARDALSIYVNINNPVNEITTDQIKKIYNCEITNWVNMGWENKGIVPVGRNPNSGTYLYFKEHLLDGEDYCDEIEIKPTTESIVKFIANNPFTIGYGGIGYLTDSVKALNVNNIQPTDQNVIDGSYPISRYLHFYTLKQPEGEVKKFIDWVISDEGQKLVRRSGYIPLWLK